MNRFALLVSVTLASFGAASTVLGQTTTYVWDVNKGAEGTGGSGNWGTAVANDYWTSDGMTFVRWDQIPDGQVNAIAQFGGTAGTVALTSSRTASALELLTDNYTLRSSSSGTTRVLTLTTGSISVNSGNFAYINNDVRVAGGSGLTKIGAGTLELGTQINSYTGSTSVTAGTLKIGASNSLRSESLSLSAGATLDLAGFTHRVGSGTLSGSGTISSSANGGTLNYDTSSDSNFSGSITGGTALTKTAGGNLTLSGTTANTATGPTTVTIGELLLAKTAGVNAIGGNLVIGDGTSSDKVTLINANQIADTSTVTLTSSGTLDLNGKSEKISTLAGAASSTVRLAGATLEIAGSTDSTFAGSFSTASGSSIVKSGSGTLTLAGANNIDSTTVSDGRLLIANSTGSGTGAGSVSVGSGGLLGGTGFISGQTINVSGALLAGNGTSTTGTLTLGSPLTMQNGSELQFGLGPAGARSNINRTSGTFDLLSSQSVRFLDFGAGPGTYAGLLTGLDGAVDVSGWTIANSGWTGSFFSNPGTVGFTLTAVPEPSTVIAAILVFGILLWLRTRKGRAKPL